MKKLIYLMVVFISFLLIVSCDDMNSIHQKYLDEGENMYVGAPQILGIFSGNERVQLIWKINSDPKIAECRIFWNNMQDSISVIPDRKEPFMQKILPLPEGQYMIQMLNVSSNGNRSLAKTFPCESYGETYKKSLFNRFVSMYSYDANDQTFEINWSSSAYENSIGTVITYVTTSGVKTDTIAKPGVTFNNITVLKNVVRDSEFSYRTLYKPNKDCIDIFSTETAKFKVVANKWTEPFPGPHILSAAKPYELHAYWYDRGFPVSYNVTYGTARTAVSTLFRVKLGDTEGTRLGFEGGEPAWGEYAIVGAGGNIGSLAANDWMVYTVDVENAGNYRLDFMAASSAAVGTIAAARVRIEVNGASIGTFNQFPGTGAWTTYQWVETPLILQLKAGENRIRWFLEAAGINFRSMKFTYQP